MEPSKKTDRSSEQALREWRKRKQNESNGNTPCEFNDDIVWDRRKAV